MRVASFVLGTTFSLLMAGCGFGTSAAPSPVSMAAVSGIIHGGPNPVKFANITLWETVTAGVPHSGHSTASKSGYGSTAEILATTTSDALGSFTFNGGPSYVCDPGEFAYLTGTGGYTGGNSPNLASVEIAAIGPCAELGSTTSIYMSEVTTVAAAYALGNFASEGSAYYDTGNEQVYIGAPANNNASAPGCTGTGSSLSCTAGGLGHAVAKAVELVDSVRFGTNPTGLVNTVPTANGAVVNSSGSIPAALVNFLGNVLQSCVNSVGGSAGDGSACGKLFTDTTVGSSVPSDTFLAAMNIAKYPANNVPTIAGLTTPISFFTPSLNSAPPDFSLAITYSGVNGTSFGNPQYVALDASDNVYAVAKVDATDSDVVGLASNGAGLYVGGASSTYFSQTALATDTLGNLWATNAATDSTGGVIEYSAASGSVSQAISFPSAYGVGVDTQNNVYFTQSGSGTTLRVIAPSGSTSSKTTLVSGSAPNYPGSGNPQGVFFNQAQDVFTPYSGTANTELFYEMLPQLAAITSTPPAFLGFTGYGTGSVTYGAMYGVSFDAAGNTWSNSGTTLYETTYNPSNGVTTLANTVPLTGGDVLTFPAMDGSNTLFFPNSTSGGLMEYSTTTAANVALAPCYAPGGVKNCQAKPAAQAPINAVVDSTGAIWLSDPSGARLVQVLGVAAPTWPALSYAHFGVLPQ